MNISEIRSKALELGWNDVGITDAVIPEDDINAYFSWVKNSYHGDMSFMENELRCYPDRFFPEAKTAIIFVSYYKQKEMPFRSDTGLVASYARGRDYHIVHRKRLKKFTKWLEETTGDSSIGFSDSSPILEKALAVRAGLGHFGKNTLVIHPKFGSFILLSGILTTLTLPTTNNTLRSRCSSCQKCLQACPTGALKTPYCLDAKRCLSYHLIESKKPIPKNISKKNPGYIFGCDICQRICPFNKNTKPATEKDFSPESGVGAYISEKDILNNPKKLYGTSLKRKFKNV